MSDVNEELAAENARLRKELDELRAHVTHDRSLPLSSEQIYESIFRLSPTAITVTRFEDGTYYDVNDSFCRIVSVSRESARGESSLSLNLWVNPADREGVKARLIQDGFCQNVEIDFHKSDGEVMHALHSAELVTIGQERFIIAITADITLRKQAETALIRERARLSATLQSHSDGVLVVDEAGHVELMNRAASVLLGVQESESLGRPVSEVLVLLESATRVPVPDPLVAIVRDETSAVPFTIVRADGTELRVVAYGSPIDGEKEGDVGGGMVLVLRDMTLQLRMEEQLRKTSRLESLGVLAGGIAHDFNNVLMGIQSNVAFARTPGVRRADQREALEDVEAAVRHGRDLTQQLLTFSRGGSPVKTNASLDELVEEVSGFALRGSNVRATIDVSPRLSVAQVDRSQICQVIENLLVNAHQAMPEGGTLRIQVRDEKVTSETSLSVPAGTYVRMTFEDDGPGISEADLPRIFDPFFSGREGGTGLGLSIVHSIVRRHGGCVQVQSTLGQGTRFDVYLPALEHGRIDVRPEGSGLRLGRERILVMDDNAAIRRSMQRLLAQLGYRVDTVDHGVDAVRAYREAMTTEPYAVTILDLTVAGGVGGKATAEELRKIDPGARIVVASGYSDDGVMADPGAFGFDACIAKPSSMGELGDVLRGLLGDGGREKSGSPSLKERPR